MPNLFSRLASGTGNLVSKAEDRVMPDPGNGLFTPEQISAARQQGLMHFGIDLLQNQGQDTWHGRTSPTFGEAVGHGLSTAQGVYGQELSDTASQAGAVRQQKMLAMRDAVSKKYAPGPNDTPETMMAKAPAMYMDHLRNGDYEAAKAVEPIVKEQIAAQKPKPLTSVMIPGVGPVNHSETTGEYTDPTDGHKLNTADMIPRMTPDQLQQNKDQHDLAVSAQALNASSRAIQESQQASNAWHSQTKPLMETEQAYGNWKAVLAQARQSNPEAYKSLITAFANSGDGLKSGLRLGMLKYVEQVDPSARGRLDIFWNKAAAGKYPTNILDGMDKVVEAKHASTINDYTRLYTARTKALGPARSALIEPPETVFTNSQHYPEAAGAAGSAGGASAYFKGGPKGK